MIDKKPEEEKGTSEKVGNTAPEYVSPKIITYTSEEILEQIGPALACSPSPCGVN
jgi:hypothetical protein